MKVITAPEKYDLKDGEVGIFLAGGITNCDNWQKDIIKKLEDCSDYEEYKENFVIFNPRRDNFDITKDDPNEQIRWEFNMLEKCHVFSMYFCEGISDQPICMYELGRNIVRMQNRFPTDWQERIVVSVESGYKRKTDVFKQVSLATNDLVKINTKLDIDTLRDYHEYFIVKAALTDKRH